jgi:hypothetical protein
VAASAWAMAYVYHPGVDPTRAYEGTDTRAFGLLIGAALAIAWQGPLPRRAAPPALTSLLDRMGVLCLVGILVLVWRTNPYSSFLYPYGFLLLSLATAALIAATVNPASRLGHVLGCKPLRWIGVRSYGIYLWQWPIIVLTSPNTTHFDALRAVLQVAATGVIAALSWRYVEDPVRHGVLGRLWRRLRSGAGRLVVRRRTLTVGGAALLALALPVLGLAGTLPAASAGIGSSAADRLARIPGVAGARHDSPADLKRVGHYPPATRTSCRSVVYIGDSTSAGEISTDYIPNPAQRLPEQLADVGVAKTIPEISAGRSIVETYDGHPDAASVARQQLADGFHGCWILALGTNEAADVAVGSNVGPSARIERMMSIIGDQPVLWVSAVTLVGSGPYAESGMQRWDRDLVHACSSYPTMRIFDWPALAKPKWFIPDGIHYYSPGYVARAHLISQALVAAFPQGQPPSSGCVVR